MKSFLQTKEWLDFQEFVGRKTWLYDDGIIRAGIVRHDVSFGKNYLYIPHGPEINLNNIQSGFQNELNRFMQYLRALGKENKSMFIKMEPSLDVVVELLFRRGFKKSKKEIQPKRTVMLDLIMSDEELFSRMHYKMRYNVHLAQKRGVTFRESDDMESFWKLLEKTSAHDKFYSHKKEYYEKLMVYFKDKKNFQLKLYMSYFKSKPAAGAIVMIHDDIGYYLHGAMDREYKSVMASYLLQWEIIQSLKKANCKYYDLWGIDAKKYPGVTKFKMRFDGRKIEYPGSFDLPLSRFWYSVYNLARRIF